MCVALSGNLPALLLTVARALTLGCQEPFLRWLYDKEDYESGSFLVLFQETRGRQCAVVEEKKGTGVTRT